MAQSFKYFSIAIALLVTITWVHAGYQCNPNNCRGQTHTLCLFSNPSASKQCNKVESDYLTQEEINEIVDVHNKYRSYVARGLETRGHQPAGYIPPLKWDPELATIAQRWANQCQFGHDKCRNTDRYAVGQNVAIKSHSAEYNAQMSDLIDMWYDEVKDFNSEHVKKFVWQQQPQIGHYTQLVWGETTTIGCGAVRYFGYDGWYNTYLVCNYGPSGNWIGQPVYRTRR